MEDKIMQHFSYKYRIGIIDINDILHERVHSVHLSPFRRNGLIFFNRYFFIHRDKIYLTSMHFLNPWYKNLLPSGPFS